MKKTFKIKYVYFTVLFIIIAIPSFSLAQEEKEAIKLEQITVTAPGKKEGVTITPQSTIINVKEYKTPGAPQNIVDIIKDRAIIDFRGQSDLVPGYDQILMRGFDANRFVTAVDGLNIETSGGIGTTQVDYGTLPLGQIECIEIVPGPHSALYSGRSEGGVLNVKLKTPKSYVTLKPDFRVATSYRSYNTQNHSVNVDGGVESVIYGLGFQNYHTDGYLRHNETDINTFSGRLGCILPDDGYISLNVTYTDRDQERVAKNDPSLPDYKSHYPHTLKAYQYEWADNTFDKRNCSYRLSYKQPTSIGNLTLGAYYNEENLDYSYYKDKAHKKHWTYDWDRDQWGGRIQDEIKFSDDHITTIGFETTQIYDGPWKYSEAMHSPRRGRHKIKKANSGYLQHKWKIIPRLTLNAGLRYENVNHWHNNWDSKKEKYKVKTIQKKYIDKEYNQFAPKSFLTYELDDLSDVLRDTSLSLGVSKIWNASPFCLL